MRSAWPHLSDPVNLRLEPSRLTTPKQAAPYSPKPDTYHGAKLSQLKGANLFVQLTVSIGTRHPISVISQQSLPRSSALSYTYDVGGYGRGTSLHILPLPHWLHRPCINYNTNMLG